MHFHKKLNEYISTLDCTAKDIGEIANISGSTLSRYRSGERVPDINSRTFSDLCNAISKLAVKSGINNITPQSVNDEFKKCDDIISTDKEKLRQNFNALISVMNINLSKLCRHTSYDQSSIFRFRTGARSPAEPERFADAVAKYISRENTTDNDRSVLSKLIGCDESDLDDISKRYDKIKNWLLEGNYSAEDNSGITKFLTNIDSFDLNEYIKVIKFDQLKVPTVPFRFHTSKYYYGLEKMMDSELDFLKATVLSKSNADVTMYSDMPMTEMAKDPDFPKKWMFGMALLLKKGLHLNQIHNLDRSFEDMMLGLESWIPMYMTGQISPYYLKGVQNNVFSHLLKVSGAAVLSGEAISGYHTDGRYYMSNTKDDIAYFTKRANELLKNAYPLMEIYREDRQSNLNAFLMSDIKTSGNRKSVLSAPPLYTISNEVLSEILGENGISDSDSKRIFEFAKSQRQIAEEILQNDIIEDSVPFLTKDEFEKHPMHLILSGLFFDRDIDYTYEQYEKHLKCCEKFENEHENYTATGTAVSTFSNLQILMHEGKWAMISKGNSPAIHFVIHHPKLRNAIENFIPPIVEE